MKKRGEIADARSLAEPRLAAHNQYLAEGIWRLLLIQRQKRGKPVHSLLVHESVSVGDALNLLDHPTGDVDAWFDRRLMTLTGRLVEGGIPFRASILMSRHSGKSLLFDLERRTVLRVADARFTQEYELVRQAFSRCVPSVPYEVVPGSRAILEPLVKGIGLSSVDCDVIVRATTELLDRLPAVSRNFGAGDCSEQLLSAIDSSDVTLGAHESRPELMSWLGTAMQSPSHGDLHIVNVRATEDGPVCIDFGEASLQPAWFDGLKLAFSAMAAVRRAGGDPQELDSHLLRFLRETVPSPVPDDWRRLAGLGCAVLGGPLPPKGWVDQRD